GPAQSNASTDRPPVSGLCLEQRLCGDDGRIEIGSRSVVRDRNVSRSGVDDDWRRSILALQLAELPLTRHEPDRIGNACAQTLIRIRASRLEDEIQRIAH